MSSIAPTPKQLGELLKDHSPIFADTCALSRVNSAIYDDKIIYLIGVVESAKSLCKNPTGINFKEKRISLLAFYNMAMTLLTPYQKDNLKNWEDGCQNIKTIGQFVYFQLQVLHGCISPPNKL